MCVMAEGNAHAREDPVTVGVIPAHPGASTWP